MSAVDRRRYIARRGTSFGRRAARRLSCETLESRRLLAGDALVDPRQLVAQGLAEAIYQESFANGSGGFTADNTGGRSAGLWHFSVGRRDDGLPLHTPDYSWYYGAFETATGGGRYDLTLSHRGVLRSPLIALPACGPASASFHYLLDTRAALDIDFVEVAVDNGSSITTLLSRADGSLPQTQQRWETAFVDLSAFAGQTIALLFRFDTGNNVFVDPEGWYVDDIFVAAEACNTAQVAGVKYNDVNGNGQQDPAEPTLGGVTMTLDGDADGDGDEDTLFAVTDNSGQFVFTDLAAGSYVLSEQAPPHVLSGAASKELQLDRGQVLNVAVPNTLYGSLKGIKFNDVNQNGDWDDNEPPISGIEFTLTAQDEGETFVAVSDDQGVFTFDQLTPGQYVLSEAAPPQVITGSVTPQNFTILSGEQLVARTGESPLLVGQFETVDTELNLANTLVASAHGYVYFDVDGNGQDNNEPRLSGALVTITGDVDGDGDPDTLQQITESDGRYNFVNLFPGSYQIQETPPAGFTGSTALSVALNLGSGQEAAALAGLASLAPGQVEVLTPALAFGNAILPATQANTVQFIAPMSVYRTDGPFPVPDAPLLPPGRAVIQGYKWHDVNQDGQWNSGEVGRPGFAFELLAAGSSNVLQLAVTDASGRFTFADLDPGDYVVRELSDFAFDYFAVATFPAELAPQYTVSLSAGQIFRGDFEQTEAPNFGGFEYSALIRPADDFFGHIDLNHDGSIDAAESTQQSALLSAIQRFQSFTVTNDRSLDLQLQSLEINTRAIGDRSAADFVRILQRTGSQTWSPPSFPLTLGPSQSLEFLVFYDPAVRVDNGARVIEQYPDWLDDSQTAINESQSRPTHTFAVGDHLLLTADTGDTFRVDLVGGSTYDSDISYDGIVGTADLGRIFALVQTWPLTAASPDFDPTSDMNVRCPNGAEGVIDSCSWATSNDIAREIGLGDIGPFNVEAQRARRPFLDLDVDNSSGAQGTNYQAVFVQSPVAISDRDARFANGGQLPLQSITVSIIDPADGVLEYLSCTPNGSVGDPCIGMSPGTTLTFSAGEGLTTAEEFLNVLLGVTYNNDAVTPSGLSRTIRIQTIGGTQVTDPAIPAGDPNPFVGQTIFAQLTLPVPEPLALAMGESEPLALDAPAAQLPANARQASLDQHHDSVSCVPAPRAEPLQVNYPESASRVPIASDAKWSGYGPYPSASSPPTAQGEGEMDAAAKQSRVGAAYPAVDSSNRRLAAELLNAADWENVLDVLAQDQAPDSPGFPPAL